MLGILLVNIEAMRGSEWLALMTGDPTPPPAGALERVLSFAGGWLASGKFVSCLAILFGVGAALIAERSLRAGVSPRAILARRYLWLMAFGLAHMLLLFPGDILFVYGVTGFALLPFVKLRVPVLLVASAAILAADGYYAFGMMTEVLAPDFDLGTGNASASFDRLRADARSAYLSGGYADVVRMNAFAALWFQMGQLWALPWLLGLFLFGFAVARAGIATRLRNRTRLLYAGACIGLAVGLPANFALGFGGPLAGLGAWLEGEPAWMTYWMAIARAFGQATLAVGYLSALSLLFVRYGVPGPLAAVGRMTLSAYILQSALALALFAGLDFYDRLTGVTAFLTVLGVWGLLLTACPLWLQHYRLGPLEWLWRSLSYGRLQPMRG